MTEQERGERRSGKERRKCDRGSRPDRRSGILAEVEDVLPHDSPIVQARFLRAAADRLVYYFETDAPEVLWGPNILLAQKRLDRLAALRAGEERNTWVGQRQRDLAARLRANPTPEDIECAAIYLDGAADIQAERLALRTKEAEPSERRERGQVVAGWEVQSDERGWVPTPPGGKYFIPGEFWHPNTPFVWTLSLAHPQKEAPTGIASQPDGMSQADWLQVMWLPTPDNVNALPEPLRQYIHDLETNADPAGTIRELAIAKDIIVSLERELDEAPTKTEGESAGPGSNSGELVNTPGAAGKSRVSAGSPAPQAPRETERDLAWWVLQYDAALREGGEHDIPFHDMVKLAREIAASPTDSPERAEWVERSGRR